MYIKGLHKRVCMLLFIARDEKGHSNNQHHTKADQFWFSAHYSMLDMTTTLRFILRAIL